MDFCRVCMHVLFLCLCVAKKGEEREEKKQRRKCEFKFPALNHDLRLPMTPIGISDVNGWWWDLCFCRVPYPPFTKSHRPMSGVTQRQQAEPVKWRRRSVDPHLLQTRCGSYMMKQHCCGLVGAMGRESKHKSNM